MQTFKYENTFFHWSKIFWENMYSMTKLILNHSNYKKPFCFDLLTMQDCLFKVLSKSAPVAGGGAVTLQLVDKDNRYVWGLSAVDPHPTCGLASALYAQGCCHAVLAGPG